MYKVYFNGTEHAVYFDTLIEARKYAALTTWSYSIFLRTELLESYNGTKFKN